jgi:hypothetical protein
MALVTVGDFAAFRGTLSLPRIGVWTADLELDAAQTIEGPARIKIVEGQDLVGTVLAGDLVHGYVCARIVGGAGGLVKTATPRHYNNATVRTVLTDLARAAGETLSSAIAESLLGRSLRAWTVLARPIGEQLAALVGCGMPDGTAWRILPDGTLWVGTETWPESDVAEWRELERQPREGRLLLGLDSPTLLPGTTLGDDRVDYVEHHLEDGVRASVWLA